MLSYNKSKLTQLIYHPLDCYPTQVHPLCIINLDGYKDIDRSSFEHFDISLIKGAENVTIHRDYALGDLIQLVPVVRLMKKRLNIKNISIITNQRFISDLSYIYSDIRFLSTEYLQGCNVRDRLGYTFNVNGLLEKDHSNTNTENAQHRVDIYLKFFGITEYDKSDIDWSVKYKGGIIVPSLNHNKKLIGLQMRGSGHMKTLPREMVIKMATALSKDNYVVLIDHDRDIGFEGTNIINTCGQLKAPQVIALLEQLDMCITMDSGILWMCHSANCPTLTFLASTREPERIALHPQYPQKAKAIDLTRYIGCEPCFETKCRCGGKVRCMNEVNYDMIETEFLEKVKLILGV